VVAPRSFRKPSVPMNRDAPRFHGAFGPAARSGVVLRGKRISGQDNKRGGAAAPRKLTEGASVGRAESVRAEA